MKHKRPTMYDVARLAGVSQPTVSRVLNHTESGIQVSEETRQRVLAVVEEIGYRPNVVARSLRTQRTQTVAMLIADLANSFYHPMARAVQDVAREYNYEVLISNSDHLYENEKQFCEIVMGRNVDGVIMVPIHLKTEDLAHVAAQSPIPLASLGRHIDYPNLDVVTVDDETAIYEAVQWLIRDCGYSDFGFVGVTDDLPPGPRRLRGFTRALDEHGLTLDPRFCWEQGDFTIEGGKRAAHDLMAVGDLPSAIVVLNDLMAIGLILTLQEAGYNIPDDVAVLGFDDIPEATILRPALTTIAQHPRDIGEKLARSLFERIESPTILPRRVLESRCKLVPRQTTRNLRT